MVQVSFDDFYQVPNLKFDILKLRTDLELVLKRRKFNSQGVTHFGAIPLNQIPNDEDSIKGNKIRRRYWTIADETVKEVKAIDQVTKARQKAHHIERDLLTERAEANRKINDIRLEAEKRDQYTAGERVALLKKTQAIEEEITQKEINAKKLLIQAQELEIAQGKNTIEDKDKLAKLQAELINLDTKKLRSQRLLQTQIITATNEEIAKKKEKNAEIERLEKEHQDNLKQIKEFTIVDEEQKRQAQRDALKLEYETLMQLAKDDKDAQFDLEFAYLDRKSVV